MTPQQIADATLMHYRTDAPKNDKSGPRDPCGDCEDIALRTVSIAIANGWPTTRVAYVAYPPDSAMAGHIAALLIDEANRAWLIDDDYLEHGSVARLRARRWDGAGILMNVVP